uniref:Alpha-N-acetylglucosaminidase n=1 Tax=Glossina pallidipes TaxID=7398 RepID=A0A1A9ZVR9_GLOPL
MAKEVFCLCNSDSKRNLKSCFKCCLWQHKNNNKNCSACWQEVRQDNGKIPSKATFTASPNMINFQWMEEIKCHARPTLKACPLQLASYDIVLTHYNALRSHIYFTQGKVSGHLRSGSANWHIIAASPLPQAGLLWSFVVIYEIYENDESRFSNVVPSSIYSKNQATELAILGSISTCLNICNITCVYLMGILVLKIKEIAPVISRNNRIYHLDKNAFTSGVTSMSTYSWMDDFSGWAPLRLALADVEDPSSIKLQKKNYIHLEVNMHYIGKDVYWYNTYIELSDSTVFPNVSINSTSESSVIYYQNVCTWGYSFIWWDLAKWIQHIDWMAMMGISLTIAPSQEQLWYEIYSELGLSEEEIDDHFTGPAFLPWLRMVITAYGTDHIYFTDPFNELKPRMFTKDYLNMTAYYIYDSMRSVDSKAIWLLQDWMFVSNIFWSDDLIKTFLLAVPIGNLLVLDLQSEQFPQYERTHSFHGQPFIWCMLHNFGGTLGMHGSVDAVNTGIRKARQMANSTMVGVGITPEGIDQNYVIYSFALERGWVKDDFDTKQWFNTYANVRYGVNNLNLHSAWSLLKNSVYAYNGLIKIHGKYVITRRPSTNLKPWTWYNCSDVYKAWQLMLDSNFSIPVTHYAEYEYDLVDITRQFLQIVSEQLYINIIAAYRRHQIERFNYLVDKLMELFDNLEQILATNVHFLLGTWLEDSKKYSKEGFADLFEFNARNQITTWGPKSQIGDYATKQWSGIVQDYYKPRWKYFLLELHQSLVDNQPFNRSSFVTNVFNYIENPFSYDRKVYPVMPTKEGSFFVSKRIFNTWTYHLRSNKIYSSHTRLKKSVVYFILYLILDYGYEVVQND